MAKSKSVVEDVKKQFIVVKIGSEQYGIDINYVDNIVRMQKITRVPKVQPYFMGVINLRGEIVPIMSIRIKMGLDKDDITDVTRIIILKLEDHGVLGILVDEVKEVMTLGTEEIDKATYDAKSNKGNFIEGVGKNGDELISLFNINSIIDESENT